MYEAWKAATRVAAEPPADAIADDARVEQRHNLSFEGDGRVSVSGDSIMKSERFQSQLQATREIADAAQGEEQRMKNPYRFALNVIHAWPVYLFVAVLEAARRSVDGPWWAVPAFLGFILGAGAVVIGYCLLDDWLEDKARDRELNTEFHNK
jgi:hypothetical protein